MVKANFRISAIPVALLLICLAACVRQPHFEPSPVNTPASEGWKAAETPPGPVEDQWWRDFDQSQLNELIREAAGGNFDLQAAAARVRQSRSQAVIAGADLWPQASASLSRRRQKQVIVGIPIPGRGDFFDSLSTDADATLQVSWEADLWGRIRAGQFAASAEMEAAGEDLRGAKQSLAGQVAKAWFGLIGAGLQVRLAEATLESFREAEDGIRSRYERGLRPPLDLRLAISNRKSAEALLEQRLAEREQAVRQLEILLGRYPAGELQVPDRLPDLPSPPPAGAPADLIARRPDLAAAERRLAAANADIIESRTSLYPSFALTGTTGFSSNQLSDVLQGDFSVWTLAGDLTAPLFQGRRLRQNIALAKSRTHELRGAFIDSALTAFSEVETALAVEERLRRREQRLAENAQEAIAAEDLAVRQYNAGLIDIITLLEAQRRSLEAQGERIMVRREVLDNRVDLYLALGGGFPETGAGAPPAPGPLASAAAESGKPRRDKTRR